jgi:HlyD family secretion protein
MKIPKIISQHRLATALCLVLVAGGTTYTVIHSRPAATKYTMAAVHRGSITAAVQATGTINPLTTVPVGSFVSGTVQYVFADFNTRVKANQVLAQLDATPYIAAYVSAKGNYDNSVANEVNSEANVNSLKANLDSDVANVDKLKAAAVYARADGKRVHDLTIAGIDTKDADDLAQSTIGQADASVVAAQAQVVQAQAQLDQAKAQVDEAKAQVESAHGSLDNAIANLNYCTITTPIDGVVVQRSVTVGQSVAASLQAPNVFTIAQDLKTMQLYAQTDESDTGNIHVGTDATFQVDAFPTELFHGRVSAIRLNATTVQNVVTYSTIIDFENPDEKLLPGETAYATIPTGQVENVIEIPNAALSFTPDMPYSDLVALYRANKIPRAAYTSHLGGLQVVWEKTEEDKLIPIPVTVGITDYVNTQMKEGNLKDGDQLITFAEGGKSSSSSGSNPFNQNNGRGGPGGGRGGGR